MVEVKFSIITPVYNTETYLERCIESVVNQTYQNWELILIDDGSVDNSLKICQKWSDKDIRIKVIAKKHEGQGIARNMAMQMAQGDYIVFLDSDDWIELDYLEECSNVINEHNPDLILFFMKVWTTEKGTVSKKLVLNSVVEDAAEKKKVLRISDATSRVHRRTLLLENNIFYGTKKYEDTLFICLPVFYADKIVQIKRMFYNYDRRNLSSTTHNEKYNVELIERLEEIYEEFERRNLYEKSKPMLDILTLTLLKAKLNDVPNDNRPLFMTKCYELLEKIYPITYSIANKKYLVWGSYTLRSAANNLVLDLSHITHFQFSSLIGGGTNKEIINFRHENGYRNSMVEKELTSEFWNIVQNNPFDKYDYIIVDLLEERYDIYETIAGYVTASDAYDEGEHDTTIVARLSREDRDIEELWKQKCSELIRILKENNSPEKIILVKTYLMESYGEYSGEKVFEQISWIRQINAILKSYYGYIEKEFKGIKIIELQDKHKFTDVDYKHGCYPWHSNEARELDLYEALYNIVSEA